MRADLTSLQGVKEDPGSDPLGWWALVGLSFRKGFAEQTRVSNNRRTSGNRWSYMMVNMKRG